MDKSVITPWTRWTDGVPFISNPDYTSSIRVDVRLESGIIMPALFAIGVRNGRIAEIFYTANQPFLNVREWRYLRSPHP